MKILINTSTLKGTGVTQVAVSFLNECIAFNENEYIVFFSPNVAKNIDKSIFPNNFTFYEFGKRSLYSLKGKKDIFKMKRLEKELKPDAVISVFGPSLWRPKAPHLMGYAYPHYVYPELPIISKMSFREKLGVNIRRLYHMWQLKSNGDYYICETEDVSKRLHDIYHIPSNNIFTVSNTANSYFQNYIRPASVCKEEKIYKFYSLCSPYPHKNLGVLNEVVPLLKRKTDKRIVFYVTIDNESYNKLFQKEIQGYVKNVGPLDVSECPSFVDSCDALFLPTLLECFSASYPEAMIMGKPILTSNLPFATTVCHDAAVYFDPYNPHDIADRIISLVNDEELRNDLIKKGQEQMKSFLSPKERAEHYLQICKLIVSRKNVKS